MALDAVAYYEDPSLIIDNARRLMPRGARNWPQMLDTLGTLSQDLPHQLLQVASGDADKIAVVLHHRSHAAAAFYPSPFKSAAVLVLDGVGEWSTTTMWSGDANGRTAQSEISFPHSIGLFYSAFTQYCGFKVNSGEYKLYGIGTMRRAAIPSDDLRQSHRPARRWVICAQHAVFRL